MTFLITQYNLRVYYNFIVKLFFILTLLFNITSYSFAAENQSAKIYDCIFKHGKTKKIAIANKEIILPLASMPIPYSSTSDEKCTIVKNKVQRNGLLLDSVGQGFLELVTKKILQNYAKLCKQQKCKAQLDCKIYTNAISTTLESFFEKNTLNYGILAEISEILQKPFENDPICLAKVHGGFSTQKIRFYKDESCINTLESSNEQYIENIMLSGKQAKWTDGFTKCIMEINA